MAKASILPPFPIYPAKRARDLLAGLRIAPGCDLTGGVATVAAGGKRIHWKGHSTGSHPNLFFILMSHCRPLVINRVQKHYPNSKPLVGFYEWDYILNKMSPHEYKKTLVKWRMMGVRSLVQFDFSVWYHDPPDVRFSAVLRNFSYMAQAQQMGFEVSVNFNNIVCQLFDEYAAMLPKDLRSIVIDANHTDGVYCRQESQCLEWLLSNYKIQHILIRTGKRKEKTLEHILKPIKAFGINYSYSPTEMVFMSMRQPQPA